MSTDTCPDEPTLLSFHDGLLPPNLTDELSRHVESCGRCLAILIGFEVDRPMKITPRSGDSGANAAHTETELWHDSSCPSPTIQNTSVEEFWGELEKSRLFSAPELASLRKQAERQLGPEISGSAIARLLQAQGHLTAYQSSMIFQGTASQLLVGEYELLSPLGSGGMGQVFKARQRRLNRVVALKMILSGHFASAEEVQRFYGEAESAANLNHPNIVAVYDVGEHQGRRYFSMAYIEGESLHDRIAGNPLSAIAAAEIVRQVAEAVHYSHEHGILHRDLKPRNILLTTAGQAMVMDFGLAKRVDSDSDLTRTGQVLGTPGYMAPEQAAGRIHEVDRRGDVYSLGAVLYAAICGRPPFQSERAIDTIKQVLENPPVPPRTLNPTIPRDLETICLKCLEKRPEHRFATAEEVAQELGRFLRGEPIVSRPINAVQKAYRWGRRHPYPVGVAALAVLLCATTAVALFLANHAKRTTRIANLLGTIEQGIDGLERGQGVEVLLTLEQRIDELRSFDVARAEDAQSRAGDAIIRSLERRAAGEVVSSEEIERLEPLIAYIQRGHAERAHALRNLLRARLSEWKAVVRWKFPDPQPNMESFGDQFAWQEQSLHVVPSDARGENLKVAWLKVPSQGFSELETVFAADWGKQRSVGVVVDGQPRRGYDLILRPDPTAIDSASRSSVPATLGSELAKGRSLCLDLVRRGALLSRRRVESKDLPPGELRLRLRRSEDEIVWQLNQLPESKFLDPFGEPIQVDGRLGILSDSAVELRGIVAQRQAKPHQLSRLEQAVELYQTERFADSLAILLQESQAAASDEARRRAAYTAALCELGLERRDDAVKRLTDLFRDADDRWALLAGCQLWQGYLAEKKLTEADAVQATLAARFKLQSLSQFVPAEIRNQLAESLRPQVMVLGTLRLFSAEDIRRLESAVNSMRLIGADEALLKDLMFQLMRAYMYSDRNDDAIRVGAELTAKHLEPTYVVNYVRLLRWKKRQLEALELLTRVAQRYEASSYDHLSLTPTLLRVLYDQENYFRAYREATQAIESAPQHFANAYLIAVYLLRGSLQEKLGNLAAARQTWAEGFQRLKSAAANMKPDNTGLPQLLMMGTLSGVATDDELIEIASRMVDPKYTQTLGPAFNSIGKSTSFTRALRNIFQRDHSRELAKNVFIWETTGLADRSRALVTIAVTEFIAQDLFAGEPTLAQESSLRRFGSDLYDSFGRERSLNSSDAAQALLAWNGLFVENFAGILEKKLPVVTRNVAMYVLGRRLLVLGRKAETVKYWKDLTVRPGVDAELKKLVTHELGLLERDVGELEVVNQFDKPLTLKLRRGEEVEEHTLAANAVTVVETSVGKCELELGTQPPNVSLAQQSVAIEVARTSRLNVVWKLRPDPSVLRLPGIIMQPARLPDGRRWQLDTRLPRGEWRSFAIGADGKSAVIGSDGGSLREINLETGAVDRVLPGHFSTVLKVNRDARHDLTATCSFDRRLTLFTSRGEQRYLGPFVHNIQSLMWNSQQDLGMIDWGARFTFVGRRAGDFRHFQLSANPNAFAWGPAPDQITVALVSNKIEILDRTGRPTVTWNSPVPVARLEWRFDKQLLAASLQDHSIALLDPQLNLVQRVAVVGDRMHTAHWSPDSPQLLIRTSQNLEWRDEQGQITKSVPAFHGFAFEFTPQPPHTIYALGSNELRRLENDDSWRTLVAKKKTTFHEAALLSDGRIVRFGGPNALQVCSDELRVQHRWTIRTWPRAVDCDRNSPRIAVAGNRMLTIVHADHGIERTFDIDDDCVVVRWSPDGQRLATATSNGKLFIFGTDGQRLHSRNDVGNQITCLDWHPRRDEILFAPVEGEMKTWVPTTGETRTLIKDNVFYARWSPLGDTLVYKTRNPWLYLFHETASQKTSRLTWPYDIRAFAWLNNSTLIVGGHGDEIVLMNLKGEALATLPQSLGVEPALWVDRQRNRLLAVARDAMTTWDTSRHEPLLSAVAIDDSADLGPAVFSPGGQLLYAPPQFESECLFVAENVDGSLDHLPPPKFPTWFAP